MNPECIQQLLQEKYPNGEPVKTRVKEIKNKRKKYLVSQISSLVFTKNDAVKMAVGLVSVELVKPAPRHLLS